MQYISTRGQAPKLGFIDVMLTGLATDGGLYVPETFPSLSTSDLDDMKTMSYTDIAFKVMWPFVEGEITEAELRQIISETYETFHHDDILPFHHLTETHQIMELFHGPTLAFKDVALQFLGRMFDYALEKRNQKITIVGATSGDTGSAAIEACRDRDNIDIFILHPHNRVSDVQRKQMTTILSDNVHNIAIEGSFDDCQNMVKAMFNDHDFRNEVSLSAINSINWARILAQVVYYVYASVKLSKEGKPVSFTVPTGNFGNIFAGYVAKQMGAPIGRLIIASNRNDILHRFTQTGEMKKNGVEPSLSPSMDIEISSNFERLLFALCDCDGAKVADYMKAFQETGVFSLSDGVMDKLHRDFASGRKDDAEITDIIRDAYQKYDYVLDPHTAVGVGVADDVTQQGEMMVTLATAHPAKFPDAVKTATETHPELPAWLGDLFDRPEKMDVLPNATEQVMSYVREALSKRAKVA